MSSGGDTGARRGRGGFRVAGAAIGGRLRPMAERFGFAEGEVLLRWNEIMGEELAGLCHPVKVSYGGGARLGATLMVRAEGAVALRVEHLAPRILERVNAHYGYRAVSRLAITQATGLAGRGRRGAMPGFAEPEAAFDGAEPGRARAAENPLRGEARAPAPATESAAAEARRLAAPVRSTALRAALERMGAFVLSRGAAGTGDENTGK